MNTYVLCIFFVYMFVKTAIPQYNSLGLLPADIYNAKCAKPMEENVKQFLMSCSFDRKNQCFFNASVPFLYWLECEKKRDLRPGSVYHCFPEMGNKFCDIQKLTNYTDPGDIIYRPLLDPDLKSRLYPEIFEAIHNLNITYVKAYVAVLRGTFTSWWYSNQYNYAWKNLR